MAKRKMIEVPTPECDKMLAVSEESQAIGEFINWLTSEAGYDIAKWSEDKYSAELLPVNICIEKLLADYFDIDLNKVEAERRAILDAIRQVES